MARAAATAALTLLAAAACGKAPAPPAAKHAAVLFVGDSLTAANDLPRVFAAIAASRGDSVEAFANAPSGSGSTARRAVESPFFVQKLLPSRSWDFAVVQENSELPALKTPTPDQDVAPHVRRLVDLIRADDPRTRLVLLATWGFKNGDAANCAYAPNLCTYGAMQDSLQEFYLNAAREHAADLAPAGWAWREVLRAHPDIELYSDDHHPSVEGTYLTACVVYASLFQKKSLGADPLGVDPSRAAVLQSAADAVVFDPRQDWHRFARLETGK